MTLARLAASALVVATLVIGGARPALAQSNTGDMLRQALAMYEALQVERALVLLRQVVSPSSPFEVSREQRVQAYTYLGASHALLGRRDSAVVYFRAALERDPSLDLSPAKFTEQEREAFAVARRRVFAVALRPIPAMRLDVRSDSVPFAFVTTHSATVRAEVRLAGDTAGVVLYARESEGLRELAWNGLLAAGRLAPPGRYELVVDARSQLGPQSETRRAYFDVRHDFPALEDTLPDLRDEELLPEQHVRSAVARDLMKGLGVAAAALVLPGLVANGDLGRGAAEPAALVAGTAAVAGAVAFVVRRSNRDIPVNIAENRRRRAERATRNAEIAARNAERLAQTRMVITPASGLGL